MLSVPWIVGATWYHPWFPSASDHSYAAVASGAPMLEPGAGSSTCRAAPRALVPINRNAGDEDAWLFERRTQAPRCTHCGPAACIGSG